MASTADVVFREAQALLNDQGATLWTNDVLRVFLRKAHVELQNELDVNGIPTISKVTSSPIVVSALATTLTLPTDIVAPITLWERLAGTSNLFVPMEEKAYEPNVTIGDSLRFWVWREETILFVGANTNREVKMLYLKSLAIPIDEKDSLGFIKAELYLGPRVAALAALSVGNMTLFNETMKDASANLQEVISANVRRMQALPARRIPYHRRTRNLKRIF